MSDRSFPPSDLSSVMQMHQLANGFRVTQAIYVAAKLEIADLVGQAPKTADELAEATKTDTQSLRRLLQLLTGLGIFEEDEKGKYRQTSLSTPVHKFGNV